MSTKIDLPAPQAAQRALEAARAQLQASGATRAYVGWHFENDWMTRQRAIVVCARAADVPAVRAKLPAQLAGFPIDVRRDSRAAPIAAATQARSFRPEDETPVMPGEIIFEASLQSDFAAVASTIAAKPRLRYVPPAGVSLAPVEQDMTLILHVSPEQGFAQLKQFFSDIGHRLVGGMYEFTAPHIETALSAALPSPETLTLTLDSPAEPPSKREQTVEQTRSELQAQLKNRFVFAWALSGLGREAPAAAFPTAYHIKVAVKDGRSFWLSSGNWNSSNQPNVDPSKTSELDGVARTSDRDWHVIATNDALAQTFEAFLLQDFKTASAAAQSPAAPATARLASRPPVVEAVAPPAPFTQTAPKRYFAPRVITGKVKIKPLLTPDDYRKPILALIESAQKRFYMQTQYIHTVDASRDSASPTHMALIDAVAQRIRAGVDVRLITSEFQTAEWIQRLQDAGIDTVDHLRIQAHVHNKGIVVDSSIVVVSSQNWSAEGTGANRDAGLIIEQAEAAQYFEEIFLHDWANMALPKVHA